VHWPLGKQEQHGVLYHPSAKAGFERHGVDEGKTEQLEPRKESKTEKGK